MEESSKEKVANELINESSPYLLQHAYNPVKWVAWSPEAFKRAEKEGKLVLISIGYSSCHWCHVMEHESFENDEVAKVMNDNFICIKVDREERPDVDQIYMTAVQLISGSGGWPLNCFTLPDGRPVFGGTYFQQNQWVDVLNQLTKVYQNNPQKLEEYADKLEQGIKSSELVEVKSNLDNLSKEKADEIVVNWKRRFDDKEGGPDKVPKFPLPNNYEFLMRYAYHTNDEVVRKHVKLTLDKMANGGIFDQIGGGFSRYSVDIYWKAPHFEKMLYDNAQLISLYSEAYKSYKDEDYRLVVDKTFEWLQREMKSESGSYFSALDADSEGVEGKFYVWTEKELKEVLKDDFKLLKEVYNVNSIGLWEHGNYILMRSEKLDKIAEKFDVSRNELDLKIKELDHLLLKHRSKRVRPGLDDKSLTAWNALLISGLCKAYEAFGDVRYLEEAKTIAKWIRKNQLKKGKLLHTFKNNTSKIDGFLDDYATVIKSMLDLYQVTFDAEYFEIAEELTQTALHDFYDEKSGMFFFTAENSELIARQMELSDNVIPASNSMMARNLFTLGTILDDDAYKEKAIQMLKNVYDGMEQYGSAYSNWGMLLMDLTYPLNEVVVTGKNYSEQLQELHLNYLPNAVFLGGTKNTIDSPLAEGKFSEGLTTIFVCQNKTCKMPSDKIDEALKNIAR